MGHRAHLLPRCAGTDVPSSSGDHGDLHEAEELNELDKSCDTSTSLLGSLGWGRPFPMALLGGSPSLCTACGAHRGLGVLCCPPPHTHTHKDRSGPFLLRQPGLNAGVVPPDPWESGLEQLNFVLSLNPWIGGVVPRWGGGRLPPTLDVPPPHGAEHPKSLTGTFGGFSSPVPPISLPENFVSVWGGLWLRFPLWLISTQSG